MTKYVIADATKDTLKGMTIGKEYTGGDLHRDILKNLRIHGNFSEPYDSTTLRSVRRYASLYGVKCNLAGHHSKYIRGEMNEAKNTATLG